ncbi:MAG TPA: hypothetical protein VJI68_03225 [Candidatus Nanoarchaeia archaeon]|nr:hypothetical protein [Candidatus Nanoarchaeia archaeon]
MGVLDFFKESMPSNKRKRQSEELDRHLIAAKENLKMANEFIFNFLNSVKDFHPAQRHQEAYNKEVINKLQEMRKSIRTGMIFIDEKRANSLNTLNSIKNAEQLRNMIQNWSSTISSNDLEKQTIIKLLENEMWSEQKASRMFPIPKNKILLSGYLTTIVSYLNRARDCLDNYLNFDNMPQQE